MNKILHIIYPQVGQSIGGNDLYSLELCEMIDRYSDSQSTILYTRKGGFSDLVKNRKIKTIYLDEKKNNLLKSAFVLKDILEKLQPTIVHTHGYDSNYLVTIYNILQKTLKWQKTKCAFVSTTHGWIKQPFNILLKTYFDYLTIPFMDGVVVVEPKQLETVNKLKKGNAITTHMKTAVEISSPELVSRYSGANRLLNKETRNNFHISYIGRLSPEKRVDLAIEVYKEILKLKPNCQCSIIGDGDYIKTACQLNTDYPASVEDWSYFDSQGNLYGRNQHYQKSNFAINNELQIRFEMSKTDGRTKIEIKLNDQVPMSWLLPKDFENRTQREKVGIGLFTAGQDDVSAIFKLFQLDPHI